MPLLFLKKDYTILPSGQKTLFDAQYPSALCRPDGAGLP